MQLLSLVDGNPRNPTLVFMAASALTRVLLNRKEATTASLETSDVLAKIAAGIKAQQQTRTKVNRKDCQLSISSSPLRLQGVLRLHCVRCQVSTAYNLQSCLIMHQQITVEPFECDSHCLRVASHMVYVGPTGKH